MKSLSFTFGQRLKDIRTALKISQEELALKCDMQPSHIGQLERAIKNPTLDTLYKIANGFGISISELVNFGSDIPVPSFDEKTNKIISYVQNMSDQQKSQILSIVKTFHEK